MIVEYIRYSVDDARAPAFHNAYRRAAERGLRPLRALRSLAVLQGSDPAHRSHRVDSVEGDMSGFRQSPRVRQLLRGGPAVRPRHQGDASLRGDDLERGPVTIMSPAQRPKELPSMSSQQPGHRSGSPLSKPSTKRGHKTDTSETTSDTTSSARPCVGASAGVCGD
jgi:hypothetical protein